MDVMPADAHALLARLDAWLARDGAGDVQEPGMAAEDMFDLEVELSRPGWEGPTPDRLVQLDQLRKKIEVVRKLYRHYQPDLSRAAQQQVLSGAAVRRLCGLMLRTALVRQDTRYLNSALKLLDGVLARDDCVFPDELQALARTSLNVLVPLVPYAA